mmetsp:Transcript_121610/g.339388  ORF Transcript_121610/g.339388 Transcript_121610/m.339388 type:complete len:299 (+) Transcript_121610:270-1166(+)
MRSTGIFACVGVGGAESVPSSSSCGLVSPTLPPVEGSDSRRRRVGAVGEESEPVLASARSRSAMYCAKDRSSSESWISCSGWSRTCQPLTMLDCTSKVSEDCVPAVTSPSVRTSGIAARRPCVEISFSSNPWPVSAFNVDVFPARPWPTNMSFNVLGRTLPCRKASLKAARARSDCAKRSALVIAADGESSPSLTTPLLKWLILWSLMRAACRLFTKASLSLVCLSAEDICFLFAAAAVREKGTEGAAPPEEASGDGDTSERSASPRIPERDGVSWGLSRNVAWAWLFGDICRRLSFT